MKKKKQRDHYELVLDASYDVDRETVSLVGKSTYYLPEAFDCDDNEQEEITAQDDVTYFTEEETSCANYPDEETECDSYSEESTSELDENDRPADEFNPRVSFNHWVQSYAEEQDDEVVNLKSSLREKLYRDNHEKWLLFSNKKTAAPEPVLTQGARRPFKVS